jgi:DNA-binding response OmpR family regulator
VATVLVAEDDRDICTVMKTIFGRVGHRVLTAADGPTTLDLARRWRPDLVTLDLSMPGTHGLEVCRALRADPDTAGVAILIVSAWDLTCDTNAGREAGADDYLVKPFTSADLLAHAESLLTARPTTHRQHRTDGTG